MLTEAGLNLFVARDRLSRAFDDAAVRRPDFERGAGQESWCSATS